MINLCNLKVISILFLGLFLGKQNPVLNTQVNGFQTDYAQNYATQNQLPTALLVAQKSSTCQKLNAAYQEIYSFETKSYYINVCRLDNNFYYHRQGKLDKQKVVLIPAQAMFGGIFQAIRGNTTYFVGKDGDRHYSSVMSNDHEMIFEPELPLPSSSLSRTK